MPRFSDPRDTRGILPYYVATQFNPFLLSGLVSYLDPRALSAGAIATTPDLGSIGGNWVQASGAAQPTVSLTAGNTGGPAIVWNGSNYLGSSLAASSWAFMHAASATIWSVFRIDANPNKQFQIGIGTAQKSAGAGTRGIAIFGDDRSGSGFNNRWGQQVKDNAGVIADYFSGNNALADQTWCILETVITAGSGIATYRNGTLLQSTAFSRAQDSGNPQYTAYLYGGVVTGGFVGKSTQQLVYNVAQTTAERAWLRAQLGTLNNIVVV